VDQEALTAAKKAKEIKVNFIFIINVKKLPF
jgi:hypothetical protein